MLVATAFPSPAAESSYMEGLIASARVKALHKDAYWETLLHYKTGVTGKRSLIDDPNFFLSPMGKRNAQDELEATLRALFEPVPKEESRHAACRFPARYEWLKEKLAIDSSRLPCPECRPVRRIIDQIRPSAVTMIFPTSNFNSPASMFGHTLIVLETEHGTRLLSHAINYSAHTMETFGPVFAVKGIIGSYNGFFSVLPYYGKLQEYSDIDQRDIWEYPLNLDAAEINRLILHLFELDRIASDYYFFDENCSYQLLFLLDAARPGLTLTDQTRNWVIPLDTVRLVRQNGLIKDSVYRPSRASKIQRLAAGLSDSGQALARSLALGERDHDKALEGVPACEKIQVLDLAAEYLQYRYARKDIAVEPYQKLFIRTLQKRSALGPAGPGLEEAETPANPEIGHSSNRFAAAVGVRDGDFFEELQIRPAYHDVLDDDRGYKKGAQIIFAQLTVRHFPGLDKFRLEELDIIDILSLAPRDTFFPAFSWKLKTGFEQQIMGDGRDHLIYELNPGGGFSFATRLLGLFYAFAEAELQLGNKPGERHSVGGGGSAGIIRNLAESWKLHAYVRDLYFGAGDEYNRFETALLQRYTINSGNSISLDVKFFNRDGFDKLEFRTAWNIFF